MTEAATLADVLARWQSGQQRFWDAASRGMADPSAGLDLPDTDAIWRYFTAEGGADPAAAFRTGPSWAACLAAGAAYQQVIAVTWARIGQQDGGGDWRRFRRSWLAGAEAAFIRTQREPAFLSAQSAVVRALAAWDRSLPEEIRVALAERRRDLAMQQARLVDLSLGDVRIAQTPCHQVWQQGRARLLRYDRKTPATKGAILIAHGLIGRQTMTDLVPERSMVRGLLSAGLDVFALDWGNAGREDAANGFDHYAGLLLGGALAATRALTEGALTLMGICQGGTLAAAHMARHPGAADRLICAVSPVDFHADQDDPDPAHGLLNLWVRSLTPDEIDALIGIEGNLSGQLLGMVFNQLNPLRALVKYTIDLAEAAAAPATFAAFRAMEKWLADRPDLPGALARQWLIELYHENRLVKGCFVMQGQTVDLTAIRVPVLNIHAEADHIIPPPCSTALARFVPSDRYDTLALPTGHIGAFVSARAQPILVPGILRWLGDDAA